MPSLSHSSLPLDQLLEGDCVALLDTLPAGCIDLIFADPPYNLSGRAMQWEDKAMGGNWYKVNEHWDTMSSDDYAAFTQDWLSACERVLKPGGAFYVCCTLHNLGILMVTLERLGLHCNNVITWYKPNAMPSMTRRTFTHATELILYFVKGTHWTFNYDQLKHLNPERRKDGKSRQMRDFWEQSTSAPLQAQGPAEGIEPALIEAEETLWRLPLCQGKERLHGPDGRALHPTQKPEALVQRAVVASSHPGEVVLDPFVGSGTTAVVAKRLGRRFIGMERDATYLEAARARLAALVSPTSS